MIFTHRFGALAARPTFPRTEEAIAIQEAEARLAAEQESGDAPAPQVHHFHLPRRKRSEVKQHAA